MSSTRGKILVVDDDQAFRAMVTDVLELAGFEPVEVGTGEEALETVQRDRPLLVLLDVSMPGKSGYSVCDELRKLYGREIPIVFPDRVAGSSKMSHQIVLEAALMVLKLRLTVAARADARRTQEPQIVNK